MIHVCALLPVVASLLALLFLRVPVWASAAIGAAVALVQYGFSGDEPIAWDEGAALLLTAALVIVPGLALNGILEARGTHRELAAWVGRVPLSAPWKTCLIVLGVGPALESLTGFGVSLLATVPILMALSPPAVAVRQAVLGMAVVPWGALGLPTLIGASQSGYAPTALGTRTALLYLVLMPVVGALATSLGRDGARLLPSAWPGAVCGTGQALLLVATNAAELRAVAGVVSGAGVALAVLLPSLVRRAVPVPAWWAVAPYAAVLGLVVAGQSLVALEVPLDVCVPVGDARLNPFVSPGVALLVACLLFSRGGRGRPAVRAAWSSRRTVGALGGFVLMAQVMDASGEITALAAEINNAGPWAVSVLSPVLALGSGFLTGSATSGNALMMPVQASLGQPPGIGGLVPAVQNAGAGIAMLASLPTASLVLQVAGLSGRDAERSLIGFDLRLLLLFACLLAGCFGAVVLTSGG
ncbi:L-lactate permease [Kocuria sabuli]|uniref:L-lactate permease n=1 Tax=Kocuria sabuli TaxID=3071448 RepID=UPI0034D6EB67